MVQEEGILGATGCMAQDETANEPGVGGPNRNEGENSENRPLHTPCSAPPHSTRVLTAGSSVLPTSSWRPSSVPEFPATMTGCRWLQRPQTADLYLLTMVAWWHALAPDPAFTQDPRPPRT